MYSQPVCFYYNTADALFWELLQKDIRNPILLPA